MGVEGIISLTTISRINKNSFFKGNKMSNSTLFTINLVDKSFGTSETIGYYDMKYNGLKYPIPRIGETIIHTYEPSPIVKEVIYDYVKKMIYIII